LHELRGTVNIARLHSAARDIGAAVHISRPSPYWPKANWLPATLPPARLIPGMRLC
jgi:hypothetical protein